MISTSEYFPRQTRLLVDENNAIEFKNHRSIAEEEITRDRPTIHKAISITICGFLNQGEGGTILLGIHDSGEIRGIKLTLAQITHVIGSIQDTISRFNPPVHPSLVKTTFIPVFSKEDGRPVAENMAKMTEWIRTQSESEENVEFEEKVHQYRKPIGCCWCDEECGHLVANNQFVQAWVVKLDIGKPHSLKASFEAELSGINSLYCPLQYETERGVAWLRIDGCTRTMWPFDISRHVNELVRNHYQPTIDRLSAKIDEKLDELGVPNEFKPSVIDSHAGMKRNKGYVIQPNVTPLAT